ncbi:lipid droplet-associated hydrolase [Cinnamomum micranthum f. kanehirae]|uniref:Lipid droplet-associated hydrolase n=1 Tax=Cinnamomum micranthum f. kanehirae TaxID=337451 RepID=A0A3S3NKU0_9MAGN|nr:lipid droplet-associated hydrolase [Cinnamomum micranthum f. kanehirae]
MAAVMSTLRFKGSHTHMDRKTSLIEEEGRKRATLRLSNISSFKAELLEIRSEDPSLHYLDFGRLFSLQDQINHKVDLIKQEVANKEIPIILVGHSIGSYISLEIFKRLPQQVKYYIGLYPFMSMNEKSSVQSRLVKITASSILRGAVSFSIALLGLLPNSASELLVRNLIGQSWSTTAIEAACTRLLRFHTMQNVLYMAMTEFQKFQLSEEPDWTFMREKRKQIAFFIRFVNKSLMLLYRLKGRASLTPSVAVRLVPYGLPVMLLI